MKLWSSWHRQTRRSKHSRARNSEKAFRLERLVFLRSAWRFRPSPNSNDYLSLLFWAETSLAKLIPEGSKLLNQEKYIKRIQMGEALCHKAENKKYHFKIHISQKRFRDQKNNSRHEGSRLRCYQDQAPLAAPVDAFYYSVWNLREIVDRARECLRWKGRYSSRALRARH